MTRLAETLARHVTSQPSPLLSNYELFRLLWSIYATGEAKYARGNTPSREVFRRTRYLLRAEGIIRQDADYSTYWRVIAKPEAAAEDIVCSVDPDCRISHISALQRYGLTNRRPEALFLTEPTIAIRRQRLRERMEHDYTDALNEYADDIEPIRATKHPLRVRGRPIEIEATKFVGDQVEIKGTLSRIGTIGQTFLDTLESPGRCGGIAHVLDIWQEHATTYLDEIITCIDRDVRPILKVRAGYILDERIGISDPRITTWSTFAQRGSSRVLNPGSPFASTFSEKWMLSVNV